MSKIEALIYLARVAFRLRAERQARLMELERIAAWDGRPYARCRKHTT